MDVVLKLHPDGENRLSRVIRMVMLYDTQQTERRFPVPRAYLVGNLLRVRRGAKHLATTARFVTMRAELQKIVGLKLEGTRRCVLMWGELQKIVVLEPEGRWRGRHGVVGGVEKVWC